MDRLVHTALSAMRSAMLRQTSTAHNLANVNTAGFRADMSVAQSMWLNGPGLDSRAFSSQEVLGADMTAGRIVETGRALDVALYGDAVLTVQASDGQEAYTRRGDLQVAENGLLTTGDGHPLIGQQGPITLPPAESTRIDEAGAIWIVPPGGDPNTPQLVDRMKLASPRGSDVVKGTDNLLRVRDGGVLPAAVNGRLVSGSIEAANITATDALVDMIEASRSWDTQMKLITTARDLAAASSELMRLPS